MIIVKKNKKRKLAIILKHIINCPKTVTKLVIETPINLVIFDFKNTHTTESEITQPGHQQEVAFDQEHSWTFCYVFNNGSRFYLKQRANADVRWTIPEEFAVTYTNIQGELTVGGVFLRLFIANPGWVLRKPKEFVTELLEKWSELVNMSNPHVRLDW